MRASPDRLSTMPRSITALALLPLLAACPTVDDSGPDGGTDGGGAGDGGAPTCFDLSLDPGIPLAVDGTFTDASPRWRRPHDDEPVCPASALLPETAAEVPFDAWSLCNPDSVARTFDFELIASEGTGGEPPLDDPYLVLYSGDAIPADARDCLAINDDIPGGIGVADSEILGVTVGPGAAVTAVPTSFTFDAGDGTGTGYWILVVTVAD